MQRIEEGSLSWSIKTLITLTHAAVHLHRHAEGQLGENGGMTKGKKKTKKKKFYLRITIMSNAEEDHHSTGQKRATSITGNALPLEISHY